MTVTKTGKNAKKIFLTVLALVMTFVLAATVLCACVKKEQPAGPTDAEKRAAAAADLTSGAIAAAGEGWSAGLTDAEAAKLVDPVGYIVASEWLTRAGELLAASAVSTPKLRALADYTATDEARELLRGEVGLQAIVSALSAVGFTSADAEETVFILLADLAGEGGKSVFENISDRLSAAHGAASGQQRPAIERAREDIAEILSAYDRATGLRESVLEAEEGIRALAAVMYEGVYAFGSGDALGGIEIIADALSGGQLRDISVQDAEIYLTALAHELGELGARFTPETSAQLMSAITGLEDAFGRLDITTSELGAVTGLLSDAHIAVNRIAYVTDMVSGAVLGLLDERGADGELTHRFAKLLLDVAAAAEGEEKLPVEYSFVLLGDLLLEAEKNGAFGQKLEQQLKDYETAADADSLSDLILVSSLLDILRYAYEMNADDLEDDAMIEAALAEHYNAFSIVAADLWLESFKTAYARGNAALTGTRFSRLGEAIDRLINGLGVESAGLPAAPGGTISPGTAEANEWYAEVVAEAERVIESAARETPEFADEDFVDEAHKTITEAAKYLVGKIKEPLEDLVALGIPARDAAPEEIEAWKTRVNELAAEIFPFAF
ncbi:MAG TPA: hypothetical protein IAC73_05270 [Candidatus Limadaptatus stercoripullorum]|uniref:Uncharacterized protein n=1 Tax=Candidatus Limadaptatus stercoripullorum TaxID=2840846 RepID=A0A9D1NA00_9FIRM|nr:hypothetical protein [Candidatus Limadaptatus stercoripullorum]